MSGDGWMTFFVSVVGLALILVFARACAPADEPTPACTGDWCQEMQEQRYYDRTDRDQ